MEILFLLACGLIMGLLGGVLGIGGGVIAVPALFFLFTYTGAFPSHSMQVAVGTSLASSLFISLLSSSLQLSKGAISFPALKCFAPGLGIGCICGAILSHFFSSELLRHIFGLGALLIGMYFAIPGLRRVSIATSPNRSLAAFGLAIGTLSSLLGIGGGILAFPTFLGYGMEPKASSATSACTTTISTLIGTLAYLFIAWDNHKLPNTLGYIDIPAFFTISLAALLSTPLGVKLSHTLDTRLMKRIFGVSLSLIGITMLIL